MSLIAVKDLELLEGLGGRLLELIQKRLDSAEWRDVSFSNFLFFSEGKDGFPPNPYLADRLKELLQGGARQIFGKTLRPSRQDVQKGDNR